MLRAAKQAKTQQEPTERSSILSKIGGAVLSPLARVGNALDTPGSMVRDIIAGQNPFDQLLTPFSDENRISGRDLLRQYGMAGKEDTLGNFAGGLAAEIATDPTMLISGLASGAGKALTGSGKATHLFKVGLPFASKTERAVGSTAAKWLDAQAAKHVWNTPAGDAVKRTAKGLFDYKSGGRFDKIGQDVSKRMIEAGEAAAPEAWMMAAKDREAIAPLKKRFMEEAVNIPQDARERAFDEILTHAQESVPHDDHRLAFSTAAKDLHDFVPSKSLLDLTEPLAQWKENRTKYVQDIAARGGKVSKINHPDISYFPRTRSKELIEASKDMQNPEGLYTHEGMRSRTNLLRNVHQVPFERMLNNPEMYTGADGAQRIYDEIGSQLGFTRSGAKMKIKDSRLPVEYLRKINKFPHSYMDADSVIKDFGDKLGYKKKLKDGSIVDVTPQQHADEIVKKTLRFNVDGMEHAKMLADKIEDLSSRGIKSVHELAPAGLHEKNIKASARVKANLDATHEALRAALVKSGGVKLPAAFKSLGLDPKRALDHFAQLVKVDAKTARKLRVDPAVVDAIVKMKSAAKNTHGWMGPLGDMVDKFNKSFKGLVTIPFPSFHARNFLSGQHMNLASEHIRTPADVAAYAKEMGNAWAARNAGESDPFTQEAMAHGVLDPFRTFEDVPIPENAIYSSSVNPIEAFKTARNQAKEFVKDNPGGTWSLGLDKHIPTKVREALNLPMQAGANLARTTEYMNRVPMYRYLRGKGLSPTEAAAEVTKLQFNYGRVTPFEKDVMKRLVPFYGFTRNVVPQIAEMLAERPGGKMAQTIRVANSGRDEGSVMPEHIAGTTAIPLPSGEDGTKKFLTGFGLTPEAAAPYLSAPTGIADTFREGLSAMTPLVKFPIEQATGQALFQRGVEGGRPLKDMDPPIGRTISNLLGMDRPVNILGDRESSQFAEHLLSNLPTSKISTTANQITNRRKGALEKAANLLTPFRTYDVDPQQQERLLQQASNVLADKLGAKTWKNRYFPEDLVASAREHNPQLAADMDALNRIWKEARRNATKYQHQAKTEQKKPDPKRDGNRAIRELLNMAR